MEETVEKARKQAVTQYRVNLKQESFERVSRWAEQIKGSRKGVKVRPSDVVDYVLMSHAEEFSNAEAKEFQERYTSDIDLAKWLVKELTAAEKRGERVSLSDLVATSRPRQASEKSPKRRVAKEEKPPLSDDKTEIDQKV